MENTDWITPSKASNISVIPDYIYAFRFERNFNYQLWMDLGMRLYPLCLLVVTGYLFLIFFLKGYMKNRPPFSMRKILVVWNIILAVFNTLAAIRSIEEFHHTLRHFGFRASYCRNTMVDNQVAMFWGFLFFCSKEIELVETMFILLRKQNLSFLHWFHHSSVIIWSWFLAIDQAAMGRWLITMNSIIHSLMYTYFALRSVKIRVPKFIAMSITTMQIVQMAVAFSISLKAFEAYFKGETCDITGRIVYISMALYPVYFLIFANFFFDAYIYPVMKKRLSKSQ